MTTEPGVYRVYLHDELPTFGSGVRIVQVLSVGRKWVHLRYAPRSLNPDAGPIEVHRGRVRLPTWELWCRSRIPPVRLRDLDGNRIAAEDAALAAGEEPKSPAPVATTALPGKFKLGEVAGKFKPGSLRAKAYEVALGGGEVTAELRPHVRWMLKQGYLTAA